MTALLAPGDRVGEALVVDRQLGAGAFGEVYRVRHEHLGLQAMKVFREVTSLEGTDELLEEARLLSTLGHPNIVRLFDAGVVSTSEGQRGYFTMEYVSGGTLQQLADGYRPALPIELAVQVIEQLASGLAAAHERTPPILHRDLTLANIMYGYDAERLRIRISDFGLAKSANPITLLASAQGTYVFMAPEVLRNFGYSTASDVWSIGVIGYLLLTGLLPYDDGSDVTKWSAARFKRRPHAPSAFDPRIDDALDRILLQTLAPLPRDRTESAVVLAEQLAEWRRTTKTPAQRAQELVEEATALAGAGELEQAAELMEQAFVLAPDLRLQHWMDLARWRRGVIW
ncbi:serine/threonine-protein kinase [Kribbella antibiotica]|uniref:serine/threonine-protein kinase n=1 Tax=Kribbella antibiotica TaxID=190195 RepID=UPI001404A717|nr:serine/threonine-protein kinase [Kribbella antibiotica]